MQRVNLFLLVNTSAVSVEVKGLARTNNAMETADKTRETAERKADDDNDVYLFVVNTLSGIMGREQ